MEVSDRYTHIWPDLSIGSTYLPNLCVIKMGAHYTKDPGLLGCVLLSAMEIAISLNFF